MLFISQAERTAYMGYRQCSQKAGIHLLYYILHLNVHRFGSSRQYICFNPACLFLPIWYHLKNKAEKQFFLVKKEILRKMFFGTFQIKSKKIYLFVSVIYQTPFSNSLKILYSDRDVRIIFGIKRGIFLQQNIIIAVTSFGRFIILLNDTFLINR